MRGRVGGWVVAVVLANGGSGISRTTTTTGEALDVLVT